MIQRIGQRASVETPNLDAVPEPYRAAVEDMFEYERRGTAWRPTGMHPVGASQPPAAGDAA